MWKQSKEEVSHMGELKMAVHKELGLSRVNPYLLSPPQKAPIWLTVPTGGQTWGTLWSPVASWGLMGFSQHFGVSPTTSALLPWLRSHQDPIPLHQMHLMDCKGSQGPDSLRQ